MAASQVIVFWLLLFALNANHIGYALPTINSAPTSKPQDIITGKQEETPPNLNQHKQDHSNSTSSTNSKSHINTTEKLKRGLANFMNHLNPAPYFVPQNDAKGSASGSQATVINDGGADAIIKGPRRLSRPLGSPLRWGR